MSDEVTAIEVERVRPGVPPRPEYWVCIAYDEDSWDVLDCQESRNKLAAYLPDTFIAQDMVRIPSESEWDYRERRVELVTSLVEYLVSIDCPLCGFDDRHDIEILNSRLIAAVSKGKDIVTLDAEWEKKRGTAQQAD